MLADVILAGMRSNAKEMLRHDPLWRRSLNRGKKRPDVKPLSTASGLRDAEYDYLDPEGSSPISLGVSVTALDSPHVGPGLDRVRNTRDSTGLRGSLPGLRGMFNKG